MMQPNEQEHILIDGVSIPYKPGQTIMDAALASGVEIPHLCHHPDYAPHGSCKLCTIKVGSRAVAACTTPATPGMRVENNSPELNHHRRAIVQMLFVDGNHYCPTCERSGNCQLQAYAYELKVQDPHFQHFYPKRQVDGSHPDLMLDRDRCIFCGLCVRASEQTDHKSVFSIGGRGRDVRLEVNSSSGLLKDADMSVDDAAANICPVGAILIKGEGFRIPIGERLYDEKPISKAGNLRPPRATKQEAQT